VLRGRTMSLGGVFMMLSCFVMCVFCHMRVLWNRYFDSLNQDFHYRLLVSDSILPPASLAVVGTQFVSTGPFQFLSGRPVPPLRRTPKPGSAAFLTDSRDTF